jgi:hypothetical protein
MSNVKSFRKFINEDVMRDTFNAFVEECFGGGQINHDKAQRFITETDYTFNGDIFRVIWAPTQDVVNQKTFKNIARYVSNKFLNDPNLYKFFYKTPEGAFASKVYVKNTEDKTGVIFQVPAKNAIDLSKYDGQNEAVKERVESTNPILFFEPLNINTIYGKIVYDQYTDEGWTLITDETNEEEPDENKNKDDDEVKPEVKPEEKKEDAGQEKGNKVTSGVSNGTKHSKFPHTNKK